VVVGLWAAFQKKKSGLLLLLLLYNIILFLLVPRAAGLFTDIELSFGVLVGFDEGMIRYMVHNIIICVRVYIYIHVMGMYIVVRACAGAAESLHTYIVVRSFFGRGTRDVTCVTITITIT